MESQRTVNKEPKNLSTCSSGRRSSTSSHSSSPEFEFWMVRNPSIPQPDLISADELFVKGVLRPLHLLASKQPEENPPTEQNPPAASEPSVPDPEPEPEPGPRITSPPLPVLSASKRWRDIFKKEKGKNQQDKDKEKEKEKEKKKEKKNQSQSGGSPAELNINIWPFSRSRSAGTSGTRPRMTVGTRKVSSAPCSRSNSAGESKSRKWPSSPSRAGVHLGRSSPVWQVRRGGSAVRSSDVLARTAEKGSGKKEVAETRRGKIGTSGNNNNNKTKVLNLNVPMCIGYKHHLNCRIDNNSATVAGIGTDPNGGSGGNGRTNGSNIGSGSNFFNLRNLFTKKDYKAC